MRQVRQEHVRGAYPRHSASAAFGGMALLVAGLAGGCVSSRPAATMAYESIEIVAAKLVEGRGGSKARLEAIRRLVDNCFGLRPEWEPEMPAGILCHIARSGTSCEVRELAACLLEKADCNDRSALLILKYAVGNPSLDHDIKQKAIEFLAANWH